jgi:hypothetical protein
MSDALGTIDLAPSLRTALEEQGGWKNAVTWKDGYGLMHVAVENGPSSHRQAMRALAERFADEWGPTWRPSLRRVAAESMVVEYVERVTL